VTCELQGHIEILKKNTRKYIIPILSITLILSNFSFAVTYTLCKMDDNSRPACQCTSEAPQNINGICLNKHVSSCCEYGKSELSNLNILQYVRTETNDNALTVICTQYQDIENAVYALTNITSYTHISQTYASISDRDIYVLNSTLLI
jgi:hypothetical protein